MKLAVLGAAESGVGAAILAQQKGYDVFVSDMGTIRPHYKEMLDAHHLAWEEGKHTPERLLDADEVVKSPGIPDDAPMVVALREKNIPILSELEFAARYTNAKMLCITGSNGKGKHSLSVVVLCKLARDVFIVCPVDEAVVGSLVLGDAHFRANVAHHFKVVAV